MTAQSFAELPMVRPVAAERSSSADALTADSE
jgi:hypothetical protein